MPLNVVGRAFKTQRVYDSLLGFRVPVPVLGPFRNLGPDCDVNSVNEPALFGYKRTSFSFSALVSIKSSVFQRNRRISRTILCGASSELEHNVRP